MKFTIFKSTQITHPSTTVHGIATSPEQCWCWHTLLSFYSVLLGLSHKCFHCEVTHIPSSFITTINKKSPLTWIVVPLWEEALQHHKEKDEHLNGSTFAVLLLYYNKRKHYVRFQQFFLLQSGSQQVSRLFGKYKSLTRSFNSDLGLLNIESLPQSTTICIRWPAMAEKDLSHHLYQLKQLNWGLAHQTLEVSCVARK